MPHQALKRNGASKHGGNHSHSHCLEVNGTSKHGGDHSHTHVPEVNGTSKHGGGVALIPMSFDVIFPLSLTPALYLRGMVSPKHMHACSDVSGL